MNAPGRQRAARYAPPSSDGSISSMFDVDDSDDDISVATIHEYAEDPPRFQRREHRNVLLSTDLPHRERIRRNGTEATFGLSPPNPRRRPVIAERHNDGVAVQNSGLDHPGDRSAARRFTSRIPVLRPDNRLQDNVANGHAHTHSRNGHDAPGRSGGRAVRGDGTRRPVLPPFRGYQTQQPVIRLSAQQQGEFWERADIVIETMGWVPRSQTMYQMWTQDPLGIVLEAYRERRLQLAGRPHGDGLGLEEVLRCDVSDCWLLRVLEAGNEAEHGSFEFEARFVQSDTLFILVWNARVRRELRPDVTLTISALARAA